MSAEEELPMRWQIIVEAFAGDPWPDQDVVDELRITNKIHVKRPGPEKRVVVAEATVEAGSADDAARVVYWRLRSAGVVSLQSSGFLSVEAVDERGQRHLPSMEAILAAGPGRV